MSDLGLVKVRAHLNNNSKIHTIEKSIPSEAAKHSNWNKLSPCSKTKLKKNQEGGSFLPNPTPSFWVSSNHLDYCIPHPSPLNYPFKLRRHLWVPSGPNKQNHNHKQIALPFLPECCSSWEDWCGWWACLVMLLLLFSLTGGHLDLVLDSRGAQDGPGMKSPSESTWLNTQEQEACQWGNIFWLSHPQKGRLVRQKRRQAGPPIQMPGKSQGLQADRVSTFQGLLSSHLVLLPHTCFVLVTRQNQQTSVQGILSCLFYG